MPDVEFTNLFAVARHRTARSAALGLAPRLRVPAVVLEIVAGIVVGPHGLGWVEVDLPVQIVALFGLAFLLFLAGPGDRRPPASRPGPARWRVLGYLVTLVLGLASGSDSRRGRLGAEPAAARHHFVGNVARPRRARPQGRRPVDGALGQTTIAAARSPTSPPSCCCRCCSRPSDGSTGSGSCCSASFAAAGRR